VRRVIGLLIMATRRLIILDTTTLSQNIMQIVIMSRLTIIQYIPKYDLTISRRQVPHDDSAQVIRSYIH